MGIKRPGTSTANRSRESWRAMAGRQTGPRSADGKARSAMRSLQYGGRSQTAEAVRAWAASLARLAKALDAQGK